MKNRVREERKRRAMTQAELSELSGVSRATISALENGASRITTTKTLLRIARALNVPLRELLCEPNEGDETLKIEGTAKEIAAFAIPVRKRLSPTTDIPVTADGAFPSGCAVEATASSEGNWKPQNPDTSMNSL